MWWSAVPVNIFEPELRSGKYCLSQAECSTHPHKQGCSGTTRRSAVLVNIFKPERRSGKYCLSQVER